MSEWDLVLRGGRVIDPESGLDGVRDVAIAAGRIAAVGTGLPPGPADVDVSGQVVTAGFIDLHSHVNDVGGLRLQALDGVTTALELEAGVTPVAEAYRRAAEQGRPVNYGFSASWALARMETVAGLPAAGQPGRVHGPHLRSGLAARGRARAADGAARADLGATWPTGRSASASCSGTRPRPARQEYLRVAGLAARERRGHLHPRAGPGRDGAGHARRRRRGDRPRGRGDRRPHALLPHQQHLAPAHRPRPGAGGPGPGGRVAGHDRGVSVRVRA